MGPGGVYARERDGAGSKKPMRFISDGLIALSPMIGNFWDGGVATEGILADATAT